MRISTRGRYGINAIYELALNYGKAPVSIKTISDDLGIPLQYLEQLIIHLRKAGLVVSARGVAGGYSLSVPPEKLNISDVLIPLEKDLAPVHCKDAPEGGCDRKATCAGCIVWENVNKNIMGFIENYTFMDLINQMKLRSKNG
jgi:Rrf2 family transcriptional regulator, cysteine metabolism repressor